MTRLNPPRTLVFSPRRSPRRLHRAALRLVSELLVVFIGVYGASIAEDRREARQRAEQARQVYGALAQELEDFVIRGQRLHDVAVGRWRAWETASTRGERPLPVNVAAAHATHAAWGATLASGGINLIDRVLFYQLAQHYARVSAQIEREQRLEAFAETQVLPRLNGGPEAFYIAGTQELRPEYRAYVEQRRAQLEEFQENIRQAVPLLADLRWRASGQ